MRKDVEEGKRKNTRRFKKKKRDTRAQIKGKNNGSKTWEREKSFF